MFLPASCELGTCLALKIKNEQDGLCVSSSVVGEIKSKGVVLDSVWGTIVGSVWVPQDPLGFLNFVTRSSDQVS